jgi:hypothetical protein
MRRIKLVIVGSFLTGLNCSITASIRNFSSQPAQLPWSFTWPNRFS